MNATGEEGSDLVDHTGDAAKLALENAVACYSMILLTCESRYLLLQRAANKRFAPGRWTGLGGRVEPHEFDDLQSAARRELMEETGLTSDAVPELTLRRVLLHNRPGAPLTLLLYFTGRLAEPVTPTCPEGTLHWVTQENIPSLDIIENTAEVIPLLIEDLANTEDNRATSRRRRPLPARW